MGICEMYEILEYWNNQYLSKHNWVFYVFTCFKPSSGSQSIFKLYGGRKMQIV